MLKRYAVIAQGSGYYGSAFATIDQDPIVLALALERSCPSLRSRAFKRGNEDDNQWSAYFMPDTDISVIPFNGSPQEKPVILFDSGHGAIDLYILKFVMERITAPNIDNLSNIARFVEFGGWRERAKRLRLKQLDILTLAGKATNPPTVVAGRAFRVGETVTFNDGTFGVVVDILKSGEFYVVECESENELVFKEVPYGSLVPPAPEEGQ